MKATVVLMSLMAGALAAPVVPAHTTSAAPTATSDCTTETTMTSSAPTSDCTTEETTTTAEPPTIITDPSSHVTATPTSDCTTEEITTTAEPPTIITDPSSHVTATPTSDCAASSASEPTATDASATYTTSSDCASSTGIVPTYRPSSSTGEPSPVFTTSVRPPALGCEPATYACAKDPRTGADGWKVCNTRAVWEYAGTCAPHEKCVFNYYNGSPYCVPASQY